MKIRRGDMVQVLSGKDRGKRGPILRVDQGAGTLVVEGLNLKKKHTRPRRRGEKGQVVEFAAPLPASRVALVCPHCQKAIRIGYRLLPDGKKERWCRKCQATL